MLAVAVCFLSILASICAVVAYNSGGYLDAKNFVLTWISGLLAGTILIMLILAVGGLI